MQQQEITASLAQVADQLEKAAATLKSVVSYLKHDLGEEETA